MRHLLSAAAFASLAALAAAHAAAEASAGTAERLSAAISADSLRGHLSFLSSDLLEGRGTPSRGLDLAAEYIAAQFRRAGLEPAGDDGYFQTANWRYAQREAKDFAVTVQANGRTVAVPLDGMTGEYVASLALPATATVHLSWKEALEGRQNVDGKVLVVPAGPVRKAARVLQKDLQGRPALVVMIDRERRQGGGGDGRTSGWLVDPEAEAAPAGGVPVVIVHDETAAAALEKEGTTVSAAIAEPVVKPVKLRNVVGVLRGADPGLKNTYVLLTAHYDHLGIRNGAIHNGANDDGSGTVSVIEIAGALAAQKQRPRRSIVFVALWGEELGLLGSRYYGRHPVFPVRDTVAHLNLEQLGRTDDSEGAQVGTATLTGFDYSTLPQTLRKAGERTGIRLWKHEKFSDAFFARSDNQALADLGVPAHTLAVAFGFPDYHGKDDDWTRVDYDNMAKINRMVALGVYDIADDPVAPRWTDVPNAKPYVEAAKTLQAR